MERVPLGGRTVARAHERVSSPGCSACARSQQAAVPTTPPMGGRLGEPRKTIRAPTASASAPLQALCEKSSAAAASSAGDKGSGAGAAKRAPAAHNTACLNGTSF